MLCSGISRGIRKRAMHRHPELQSKMSVQMYTTSEVKDSLVNMRISTMSDS